MYEKIKTIVLALLVLLSVILTWQLWTFQPDYALLENEANYVENIVISDERKMEEIIQPEQIVIHQEENIYLLEQVNPLFRELYGQLLQSHLTQITLLDNQEQLEQPDEAIEIIFPTGIPSQIILSIFEFPEEERGVLKEIERLLLYTNESKEKLLLRFISYKEQQVIETTTTLSVSEFFEHYLVKAQQLPKGFAFDMNVKDKPFRPPLYLPEEERTYRSVSYTTSPILVNAFTQLFFTEPSSVRYFRQENNDELYTDGNRMINVTLDGILMEYVYPIFSDAQERSQRHVIAHSADFINSHGGWTDQYVLDSWSGNGAKEEAVFRLKLNGLPVINLSGQDAMKLKVVRTGNQTSGYSRPLLELNYYLAEVGNTMELPSGHEVIEKVKNIEYFLLEKLEKVIIGYEIQKNNAIIVAEPAWFILYDGHWQKILFTEKDDNNGLE